MRVYEYFYIDISHKVKNIEIVDVFSGFNAINVDFVVLELIILSSAFKDR